MIQFIGHANWVEACAVSSDGSRLFSGSSDKSIRVWDMTTGRQLEIIMCHTDRVNCLALSGSLLVSGSHDGSVKLFDTESLQLVHNLRGHSDVILSVAVAASSDGSQLVLSGGGLSSSVRDNSVRVWDAASGAQLTVLQGHPWPVRGIAVSSDGRMAASASSDRSICVWDLASSSLCARLVGHGLAVQSVLFV